LADLVFNFRSLGQRYGQHLVFGHQTRRCKLPWRGGVFPKQRFLREISPGSKRDLRKGYVDTFKIVRLKHLTKTPGVSFLMRARTNYYSI